MSGSDAARMAGRMILAFLVGGAISMLQPSWWPRMVAPIASVVINASCPYIASAHVTVDGGAFRIDGEIRVNMTLADGTPVPAVAGFWSKRCGQAVNMLLVALAVWAAPVVPARRRCLAFPVTLLATAIAAAFNLAVETQTTALASIGLEWLPGYSLAGTVANMAAFETLENWYQTTRWIKTFNDGGGRLFWAVLSGLAGYTLPSRKAPHTGHETLLTSTKPADGGRG